MQSSVSQLAGHGAIKRAFRCRRVAWGASARAGQNGATSDSSHVYRCRAAAPDHRIPARPSANSAPPVQTGLRQSREPASAATAFESVLETFQLTDRVIAAN